MQLSFLLCHFALVVVFFTFISKVRHEVGIYSAGANSIQERDREKCVHVLVNNITLLLCNGMHPWIKFLHMFPHLDSFFHVCLC